MKIKDDKGTKDPPRQTKIGAFFNGGANAKPAKEQRQQKTIASFFGGKGEEGKRKRGEGALSAEAQKEGATSAEPQTKGAASAEPVAKKPKAEPKEKVKETVKTAEAEKNVSVKKSKPEVDEKVMTVKDEDGAQRLEKELIKGNHEVNVLKRRRRLKKASESPKEESEQMDAKLEDDMDEEAPVTVPPLKTKEVPPVKAEKVPPVKADRKPPVKAEKVPAVKAVPSMTLPEGKPVERPPSPDAMETTKAVDLPEENLSEDEEVVVEEGKGKKKTFKRPAKVKGQQPGVGDGLAGLAKSLHAYDAEKDATWEKGQSVPFLFLAKALDEISSLSGRLAMTEKLGNVFRTVIDTTPDDLLPIVYLAANKIAPPHEGIELGIGDATLIKALSEATGRKESVLKKEAKESGDLGLIAQASRNTQRVMVIPKPLTSAHVLNEFRLIAKETGAASQDKKRQRIRNLLVAARECEPQYLVRMLQGKMRIGLAEQTVLQALAHAAVLTEKEKVSAKDLPSRMEEAGRIMKKVYSELPSYDLIIPVLLGKGIRALPAECHFTIGVPVRPMLAKPTKGATEILDKFQDTVFTCEYKYDGERAQIHYKDEGKSIQIYSRNAENVTERYPDLLAAMKKYVKPDVNSFVLDCEVVAFDRAKNKILPFQILSTRGRKAVQAADVKVQICLYAFDCLYLNGKALLEEQLSARREALYASFVEVPMEFLFATAITTRDIEEIQTFLQKAVDDSCEGLIVKTLETEATYEPSQRSNHWLKLKKDYMDTIGDTVDLVPIGGFLGRGKRAGFYGAFLLACFDEDKEEFQSVCKIGTGFSEAMLEERSKSLREKIIPEPKNYYRFGEKFGSDVDVWFDTREVWEVKAADLSISPVHQAAVGIVDPGKGIGLRFPRFLRVREDKKPEEATTAQQIADMYRAQKIHHAAADENDDD